MLIVTSSWNACGHMFFPNLLRSFPSVQQLQRVWLCTKLFLINYSPQPLAMLFRALGSLKATASHIIILTYALEYYDTQELLSWSDTCLPTVPRPFQCHIKQLLNQKIVFLIVSRHPNTPIVVMVLLLLLSRTIPSATKKFP